MSKSKAKLKHLQLFKLCRPFDETCNIFSLPMVREHKCSKGYGPSAIGDECAARESARALVAGSQLEYWRSSVVHTSSSAGEGAITIAKAGYEPEALLLLWQV